MRWAWVVVILAVVALVVCGCGLKNPQAGAAKPDLAVVTEIDSVFAAAIRNADGRSIDGATLDADRWQVDDLVFDVAGPGLDWAAASHLTTRARAQEIRLMIAREAIARGGQSENPFAVANGNGARPVRFRAVGTEHVLEITNLDMADVLLTWQLKNGQYTDRIAAEVRRDGVRKQADTLRESITVVAEEDTMGDIAQALTESPFAPMAGMAEAAMADAVFDAADRIDWEPSPGLDSGRKAMTTISARELRKSVADLLAAVGAPEGAARPAGARAE